MAIQWTDFPERVELFGDLVTILEGFERDVRSHFVHSGSCEKETDQSAYSVEFFDGGQFNPRPGRILGWDDLATLVEREFYRAPDFDALRMLRGRVSEVLDVPLAAVNQMTIPAVVAALAEADRAARIPDKDTHDPLAEFRILKVTQVAKLFALNPGVVSKRCDDGTYVTNGLSGHDRRVDVLSVIRQQLAQLAKQASPDAE